MPVPPTRRCTLRDASGRSTLRAPQREAGRRGPVEQALEGPAQVAKPWLGRDEGDGCAVRMHRCGCLVCGCTVGAGCGCGCTLEFDALHAAVDRCTACRTWSYALPCGRWGLGLPIPGRHPLMHCVQWSEMHCMWRYGCTACGGQRECAAPPMRRADPVRYGPWSSSAWVSTDSLSSLIASGITPSAGTAPRLPRMTSAHWKAFLTQRWPCVRPKSRPSAPRKP